MEDYEGRSRSKRHEGQVLLNCFPHLAREKLLPLVYYQTQGQLMSPPVTYPFPGVGISWGCRIEMPGPF